MCDYSLGGLPNRLATEGEELIVHRFPTHSIGLASPAEVRRDKGALALHLGFWDWIKSCFAPACECHAKAVCIPPGARLVLMGIPEDLQNKWHLEEEEPIRFVQLSAEVNTYRDAIRFQNG